jgi:adhesin transport system outer membrane protein
VVNLLLNLKRLSIVLGLIGAIWLSVPTTGNAITLEEAVSEAISTHPRVLERLKLFRATQQDLNIADSGYLPKLDLISGFGYKKTGGISDHVVNNDTDDIYRNTLSLTQNLFQGFATQHQVEYEKARVLASAYNYIETANDIALQMVGAYLNLLKQQKLLANDQDHVARSEAIYQKVYDLYVAGHSPRSEIDKIQSTLFLSRSNLTVQRNNLIDARYKFRNLLGRNLAGDTMPEPHTTFKLPVNHEQAAQFAINNNPSILVRNNKIQAAKALQKKNKSRYYPRIDAELTHNYNRDYAGSVGHEDRFQAMLNLRYNFYNGGADRATIQKNVSQIHQEVELRRNTQRDIIQQLDLSWSTHNMLTNQLDDLKKYLSFSKSTMDLYTLEYKLGKRSLLDLLAANNDYFNAQKQLINTRSNLLLAKYRILDAMGVMVPEILDGNQDYYAQVNLQEQDDQTQWLLDKLPIELDVDKDHIPDNQDLCANSLPGNNIMPYGCVREIEDSDADGIPDDLDLCPSTPVSFDVDQHGCPSTVKLTIKFIPLSAKLDDNSGRVIERFAKILADNPSYNAVITGHTDNVGSVEENLQLSQQRAMAVKQALIDKGIAEERLHAVGLGENHPIANNTTEEGRKKNRRIEIELYPTQETTTNGEVN